MYSTKFMNVCNISITKLLQEKKKENTNLTGNYFFFKFISIYIKFINLHLLVHCIFSYLKRVVEVKNFNNFFPVGRYKEIFLRIKRE